MSRYVDRTPLMLPIGSFGCTMSARRVRSRSVLRFLSKGMNENACQGTPAAVYLMTRPLLSRAVWMTFAGSSLESFVVLDANQHLPGDARSRETCGPDLKKRAARTVGREL
jgi:hypothetical protein